MNKELAIQLCNAVNAEMAKGKSYDEAWQAANAGTSEGVKRSWIVRRHAGGAFRSSHAGKIVRSQKGEAHNEHEISTHEYDGGHYAEVINPDGSRRRSGRKLSLESAQQAGVSMYKAVYGKDPEPVQTEFFGRKVYGGDFEAANSGTSQ